MRSAGESRKHQHTHPGGLGGITMGGFTQTPPTRAEQVSLKTDRAWQSRRGLGLSRKGEKDEKNP